MTTNLIVPSLLSITRFDGEPIYTLEKEGRLMWFGRTFGKFFPYAIGPRGLTALVLRSLPHLTIGGHIHIRRGRELKVHTTLLPSPVSRELWAAKCAVLMDPSAVLLALATARFQNRSHRELLFFFLNELVPNCRRRLEV